MLSHFFKKNRKFLAWNALSSFTGGMNYALSTHSMLHAVGIDNSVITATGAFIGKDIIGQTGALLFAYSKKSAGADVSPIKHGVRMTYIITLCNFLENSTILMPEYFLFIAGLSNIGKNISMIGLGSVSMKCVNKISSTETFDCSGEVYSKIAAQNSICSSLGMASAIYLTVLIPDNAIRLCTVAPIVSVIHIYAYRKSLESVFTE